MTKTITLSKQADQNTTDIKELQREVREIHSWLEWLVYELQKNREETERVRKDEQNEREKMTLRLENELLKFERRLPSGEK